MVLDRWGGNGGGEVSSSEPVELEAGRRYPIVIETQHGNGGAGARFYWNQPDVPDGRHHGIARNLVTAEHLVSGAGR